MKNIINSKCPQCGKLRIVSSSYQEIVGNSVITFTQTVCPDPDCQSKLEEQLEREKERRVEQVQSKLTRTK